MSVGKDVIKLGQIEVQFLLESSDTGGVNTVFEFAVGPGAKVPAPHYHEGFDELLYGLEGTLSFFVEGEKRLICPGDHLFVPRGAVHYFVNEGAITTRVLTVITPGLLGPEYFLEISAVMSAGGPPDPTKVAEVMQKHGLVAVPS